MSISKSDEIRPVSEVTDEAQQQIQQTGPVNGQSPQDQQQQVQEASSPEPSPTKKTIFFSLLSKFQSQDKLEEPATANLLPPAAANNSEEEPKKEDSPTIQPPSENSSKPTNKFYTKLAAQSKKLSNKVASGPDPRKTIDFVEEQTLSTVYHQIPERVLFAKGCGAYGYFQLKSEVLKPWCDGGLFGSTYSKQVTAFVRFSSLNGCNGTPETVRDIRGFSVRFYDDDGNFDLVGTNFPVFFIRNPSLFPHLVRSMRRHPVTNLRDPTAMWTFFANNPESVHALMMLFSDRGLPAGYRYMNGYGCHAYKLVNKQGEFVYAKFTWKTKNGVQNLAPKDADRLAAIAPDHCSRDFYTAIVSGEPPTWELYVQVMTPEQAKKVSFSPFDATKVWPLRAFPLQLVGLLTINHNPTDFFADVEQISFNPGNLPPGIEPSPDPMFQTRLSVYPKAALYRLGRNYHQLAVNKESEICRMKCLGRCPMMAENSHNFSGEEAELAFQFDLAVNDDSDNNNFSQPGKFWSNVLDNDGRKRLCANIASDLKDANGDVQTRMIQVLSGVNQNFGKNVAAELERWEALKGSWTCPDDVPALLSAYLHYGIDQFSISTPNLSSLTAENEKQEDNNKESGNKSQSAGKQKRNKRGSKFSHGDGCRKLRENCRIQ